MRGNAGYVGLTFDVCGQKNAITGRGKHQRISRVCAQAQAEAYAI
jgi:hypothetical protein